MHGFDSGTGHSIVPWAEREIFAYVELPWHNPRGFPSHFLSSRYDVYVQELPKS